MKFKLLTALAITGAMATSAVQAQDPIRISFVNALTAGEWNTEISAGAEAAIEALGFPVDLKVVGPTNFDPGRQATIFQQEVQTSPDAIITTMVAAPLFIEPGLQAKEAGVQVVWINSAPAAEFAEDLFVSADPTEAGITSAKVIAEDLAAKMGKSAAEIEGEAVVGHCVPGLPVLENRIAGFREGLKQVMPKVTVLPTLETKPDREGSFVVWSQAIRRNPNAVAYVDACEAGMQNITKIIQDDNLSASTVSMDSPEDIRFAVKEGDNPAIVNSLFFVQSYVATYLTAKALHDGTELPKGWLKIDPHPIGQDEIDAYINAWNDLPGGLAQFHKSDIDKTLARAAAGEMADIATYNTPELD